jgi:hypothetical protein
MASPAERRRRRLRTEHEINDPPPTDAEAQADLDARRASIAADLDAEVEKVLAQTEAALAVPLDPALRALIIDCRLAEYYHRAGGEPLACALWWLDAHIRFMGSLAGLLRGIDTTTSAAQLARALHDYQG